MAAVLRSIAFAALAVATGSRAARAACAVDLIAAPATARAAIERWVAGESRCRAGLVVRVVATADHRLALTATDADGNVRERVVPDAEAAAALVVSWIADDAEVADEGDEAHADAGSEMGDDAHDVDDDGEVASPSPSPAPASAIALAPASESRVDDEAPDALTAKLARASESRVDDEVPDALTAKLARATRTPHRTVMFGGFGHRGGRVQVDVLRRSHWVVGIAGAMGTLMHDDDASAMAGADGPAPVDDHRPGMQRAATLYAGTNVRLGPLRLRVQLGIGAGDRMTYPIAGDGMVSDRAEHQVGAYSELAVFAAIPIVHGWGIVGGPVVQRALGNDRRDAMAAHDEPATTVFAGVEHGL